MSVESEKTRILLLEYAGLATEHTDKIYEIALCNKPN